jgi:hypothetical protein
MAEVNSRKAALIAEIEFSRAEMRQSVRRCEASLNPVEVVRASVKQNPVAWLSGAALVGLALSRLAGTLRGSAPTGGRRGGGNAADGPGDGGRMFRGGGVLASLCSFGFELVRPMVTDWATEQISNLVKKAEVRLSKGTLRGGVE